MFEASNHTCLIVRYSEFILDFLLILRVLRLFKIIGSVKRYIFFVNIMMVYKCVFRAPFCKLFGTCHYKFVEKSFFKNIEQSL